ncbi:MAG TPA: LPS export ABC transporter periplasmic protein LptC [Nitrospirota bacterium]|nr:LPS export ABC transporter periplasmic protein LptC [Nitrospirota bacterium]
MKATPKLLTALILVLIIAAVFYGSYSLLREATVTMPSLFHPPSGSRLLMSMHGFQFIQTEQGNISWRMNANSADLFENKEAQLKNIEIIYTSSDKDKKEASVFGERGTMDTTNGNASIRRQSKDVKIVTSDGYLLTTNSLSWKAGDRLVWTTEPFKLLGKEIYLEGVGFSANVDMRTIVVKNNVKAVLQE